MGSLVLWCFLRELYHSFAPNTGMVYYRATTHTRWNTSLGNTARKASSSSVMPLFTILHHTSVGKNWRSKYCHSAHEQQWIFAAGDTENSWQHAEKTVTLENLLSLYLG